jgi:phage terminase Nu1 subunit (DNA packaging protein)
MADKHGPLNAETIEAVLERDIKNLSRSVANGKPLTPAQRKRLEDALCVESARRGRPRGSEFDFAHLTIEDAARMFGVTKKTIYAWGERGLPIRRDDKDAAYCASREVIDWYVSSQRAPPEEFSEQLERYRKIKADAAEFDLEIKRGKFLALEDVCGMVRSMGERVRAGLQAIALRVATKLATATDRPAHECEDVVRSEINGALKALSKIDLRGMDPVEVMQSEDDDFAGLEAETVG